MWAEKIFEEKMTKSIDDIYINLFSKRGLCKIDRSKRDNNDDKKKIFMDRELAIDTFLYFQNGSVITFQEKTLRHTKQKYQSFTFEYYNDPKTKEEGEWFKLASQLYFFGYANKEENGYLQYWILNIPKLRLGINKYIGIDTLEKKYLRYNPFPSKSNFFAIPFSEIEKIQGIVMFKS